MINDIILFIKQDKKLYNYLKYHSYWYKILIYDNSKIKELINEMKINNKETTKDKIEDLNKKIQMISSLLEVLS